METIFTGGATRMWLYAGIPDSSVHNAGGAYAEAGEIFLNTNNNFLYFCYQGGVSNQIWTQLTYFSQLIDAISNIPQSDWDQVNTSAIDYIKNKPIIPFPQIQSDWTQSNNSLKDYIKNKPNIPNSQVQSNWSESNSSSLSYILNKPTIPASQIQSNWNQSNSLAVDFILNKPTIPSPQIQSDWSQGNVSSVDFIKNKPSIPSGQVQSNWTQTVASSVDYILNKPTIPAAQIQSDWNQSNNLLVDYIKNKPTIPSPQIQSDWTQSNILSVDYIKNKPAARSQSSVTRALNTVFQVSASRWSTVRYSVDISTTVSLTGSQVGTVTLEIASDLSFTTAVQTILSFTNGNSGTLVVGLVLTQLSTACLSADIPPGYYVRLRTTNVTGTPIFTYKSGQETLV